MIDHPARMIHDTDMNADSPWRVWSTAAPRFDQGVRYQFVCYTQHPAMLAVQTPVALTRGSDAAQPVLLPAGINNSHAENQVCRC
jgi:hypothetical protein